MPRRPQPDHRRRGGPARGGWLATALFAVGAMTCFTGDGLVDQPCERDEDCNTPIDALGHTLECRYHVCGYAARCGDGIVDAELEQCDNGLDNLESDHGTRAGDCSATGCRLLPYCGDKVVDAPREQCDDGNPDNSDVCLDSCRQAVCGDGFVGPGEACDPKADENCTDDCAQPTCGDGVLQGTEECDDGNAEPGDDCIDTCLKAVCGDKVVWVGIEACDDANSEDQDTCIDCEEWRCGDGFVGPGEACDDGNEIDDDACTGVCALPSCGDGVVQDGEQCDDANADDADFCLSTCLVSSCGDAILHVSKGEECDDGDLDNSDDCLTTCKAPGCGDGFVQAGVEECDDGGVADDDGCSATCKHEKCGDGIKQDSESCDDGNGLDGDGCSKKCVFESCGDAVVQGQEQCDDGNAINTDDCVACQDAACGDGVTWKGNEQCDDGNLNQTDACLDTCAIASCGDGFVRAGVEACDDADADNSDGCVKGCKLAACGDGYLWAGQEVCDDGNISNDDACLETCEANVCGDGFVDGASEGCDDANLENNDGCANACTMGAVALASGESAYQTCAVRGGGVRCWGRNSWGQLGNESSANLGDEPGELPSVDIKAGGVVSKIVAGEVHACALLATKKVRCWGLSSNYSLGVEQGNDGWGDAPGEMPTAEALVGDVADIDTGAGHTCVLFTPGSVRCWGSKSFGVLGQPGLQFETTPDKLPDVFLGGVVQQVAVGTYHNCAVLVGGGVRCWGRNDYGQLGYPGVDVVGDNEKPGDMPLVNVGGPVVQVDVGLFHSCALLASGALRCWGRGSFGALGYKNTAPIGDDETPASAGDVKMIEPGDQILEVAAGESHTCVLLVGGGVRCWGQGFYGALGYGNTANIGEHPSVAPLVDVGGEVRDLALGRNHSCALLDGGRVRCWGLGGDGQLGVNHTANIGDGPGEMPPVDSPLYANP